jgi:hypothetical protein
MFTSRRRGIVMRIGPGRLVALAATALIAAVGGCGDGAPAVDTTTAEATVSGKVMLKGKPAAGSTISFDPSNIERKDERARSAKIGPDGSYSVTTLAGQNRVSFTGPAINKFPEIANVADMHELEPGENTLDFSLPESGAANPGG